MSPALFAEFGIVQIELEYHKGRLAVPTTELMAYNTDTVHWHPIKINQQKQLEADIHQLQQDAYPLPPSPMPPSKPVMKIEPCFKRKLSFGIRAMDWRKDSSLAELEKVFECKLRVQVLDIASDLQWIHVFAE